MKRPGRKVVRVVDGDTFKVARSVRAGHMKSQYVRVANFNAPEKRQRGGAKATQRLRRMVQGKRVTLQPVGRSYNRVVAKVYVRGKGVAKALKRKRR